MKMVAVFLNHYDEGILFTEPNDASQLGRLLAKGIPVRRPKNAQYGTPESKFWVHDETRETRIEFHNEDTVQLDFEKPVKQEP